MKNITKKFNNKKGFALTEVLLAIAVIIIIGIGAYSLYSSSRDKAKALELVNDSTAINVYIQNLLSGQKDTTYLSSLTSKQVVDQFNASQGYSLPDDPTVFQIGAFSPKYFNVVFYGNTIPAKGCTDFLNNIVKTYEFVEAYDNDFGGYIVQDLNNIQKGPSATTASAAGIIAACHRANTPGGLIQIVNYFR